MDDATCDEEPIDKEAEDEGVDIGVVVVVRVEMDGMSTGTLMLTIMAPL